MDTLIKYIYNYIYHNIKALERFFKRKIGARNRVIYIVVIKLYGSNKHITLTIKSPIIKTVTQYECLERDIALHMYKRLRKQKYYIISINRL